MKKWLDFRRASIRVPGSAEPLTVRAAQILQEEIQRRTGLLLPLTTEEPDGDGIWVAASADALPPAAAALAAQAGDAPGREGFRLAVSAQEGRHMAVVLGTDAHGALYGVGRLLRSMRWHRDDVAFPDGLRMAQAPVFALRGHQLGYRAKTNAYDAWTPEIYDQYMRELALFGANAVELLPPLTDDDPSSPLMPVEPLEMIGRLSAIAHSYGLAVWVWYPHMADDYTDPATVEAELAQRREVFTRMPYLDHLFIPGGDPGELEPEPLFDWARKVSEVLHESHPEADVWLSPQTFNPSRGWTDAFYEELRKEPAWLGGVVFGPWEKDPAAVLRAHTPARYPLRNYPDIGHSYRCQFPVPQWDLPLALTLGRECINPRPLDEKQIHHAYCESFIGSIGYSEGINDDVNKFVWLDQEWNPDAPVVDTLRDYAGLLIDWEQRDDLAQGILSLERNFRGPLAVNENVETCLMQWQDMERRLCSFGRDNYRFEMNLLRAYFDAYQKNRYLYETHLEKEAMQALWQCRETGAIAAMDQALDILERARKERVCPAYRKRIEQLSDALFEHIGMQLTVSRHGGQHWVRGAFVECLDIPLNDYRYLTAQFARIREAKNPTEILASANPAAPGDKAGVLFDGDEAYRIELLWQLLNRTNPGPGGFYDNMGCWSSWHRVRNLEDYAGDPGFLHSALGSFVMQPPHDEMDAYHMPLAWQWNACAMYMTPLTVCYDGLDPEADYLLRTTYLGYFGQHVKLDAQHCPIHDYIITDRKMMTLDFVLPRKSYETGHLELTFTAYEGERGISVAEIWIIKQPRKL